MKRSFKLNIQWYTRIAMCPSYFLCGNKSTDDTSMLVHAPLEAIDIVLQCRTNRFRIQVWFCTWSGFGLLTWQYLRLTDLWSQRRGVVARPDKSTVHIAAECDSLHFLVACRPHRPGRRASPAWSCTPPGCSSLSPLWSVSPSLLSAYRINAR